MDYKTLRSDPAYLSFLLPHSSFPTHSRFQPHWTICISTRLLFFCGCALIITCIFSWSAHSTSTGCLPTSTSPGLVQFSCSVTSDSLWPHELPGQGGLSITNSQSSLKHMSIKSVMPSSHLILCHPLLLPPIRPSIRVFSNESTLRMRWPKYWSFSFSIIPSKEIPGLILQSKGLSRVFSNTTVQKHQFFSAQLSSQSNSHIHTWPLEKP